VVFLVWLSTNKSVLLWVLIIFLVCVLLLLQATSGIGAAAAYDLSKEGFYVVLGTLLILVHVHFVSFVSDNNVMNCEDE